MWSNVKKTNRIKEITNRNNQSDRRSTAETSKNCSRISFEYFYSVWYALICYVCAMLIRTWIRLYQQIVFFIHLVRVDKFLRDWYDMMPIIFAFFSSNNVFVLIFFFFSFEDENNENYHILKWIIIYYLKKFRRKQLVYSVLTWFNNSYLIFSSFFLNCLWAMWMWYVCLNLYKIWNYIHDIMIFISMCECVYSVILWYLSC